MSKPVSTDLCSLKKATREVEERLISQALAEAGGSCANSAKLLGISHRALLYKIKRYGLDSK